MSWKKLDDEEPCEACNLLESYAKFKEKKTKRPAAVKKKAESPDQATSVTEVVKDLSTATESPLDWPEENPPDLYDLGKAGWTIIHTVAAYYPEQPSTEEKEKTRKFFEAFGDVYPCKYCANDFRDKMKQQPPQLNSRKELCQWTCNIHNEINEMLGKSKYDCSKFDKRWRIDPRMME